jgi:hypothetical protein
VPKRKRCENPQVGIFSFTENQTRLKESAMIGRGGVLQFQTTRSN